jgi:hypothetical protein
MDAPALPAEGGCRCGALRVRMTAQPIVTSACHCRGCQRMSASAFSLTVTLPEGGLEVVAGETVLGGLRGDDAQHHHCPKCLSWVFTTAPALAGFVNLRATMLDDPSWFAPFLETYTIERLPWAVTPARHSFERFPSVESYMALSEEYAKILGSKEN